MNAMVRAKREASPARDVPRPFAMPWGKGEIVEEATTVDEWHEPAIQLLRYDDGSYSVRFAHYDHRGRFQRSPLMMSAKSMTALRRALKGTPRLHSLLRRLVE
jgi:hypothetical protein